MSNSPIEWKKNDLVRVCCDGREINKPFTVTRVDHEEREVIVVSGKDRPIEIHPDNESAMYKIAGAWTEEIIYHPGDVVCIGQCNAPIDSNTRALCLVRETVKGDVSKYMVLLNGPQARSEIMPVYKGDRLLGPIGMEEILRPGDIVTLKDSGEEAIVLDNPGDGTDCNIYVVEGKSVTLISPSKLRLHTTKYLVSDDE